MEYIFDPRSSTIDFERYASYVESIRNRLQPHVYAFASDSKYFDLTSHSSLHDAWLEHVTVHEDSSGPNGDVRRLAIDVSLLGAFHDRRILLSYSGVTAYTLVAPPRHGEKRFDHIAHGDLITHELRLGANDGLIHEILFERGGTFLVECAEFAHREEEVNR